MVVKSPPEKRPTRTIQYWKAEHDKKAFLIRSFTSLLNNYGTSTDLENLHRVFLLTIMGQFVVSDACYYARNANDHILEPALVFGRRRREDLPRLDFESEFVAELGKNPKSQELGSLPAGVTGSGQIAVLNDTYHVVTPLFLKEKMMGVLFLGKKMTGVRFNQADLEVLASMCAASAAIFNNALLYRNAQHSAREIKRLYDIRTDVINRITHEFRTPLTIIRGGIELLSVDPKHKDLCKLFFDSETRLEELINSLLRLNEEDSRLETIPLLIDPLATLHQVVHYYTNSKAGKNIQFVLRQDPNALRSSLRIRGDDFRAILHSILENAVKFSPEKSTVDISVEISAGLPCMERDGSQLPEWRSQTYKTLESLDSGFTAASSAGPAVRIPAETPERLERPLTGEYFVVRITDKGIGIPEADIPLVAEPFRQASNSPDVGIRGSGLGLALAHKTITKHRGFLCCKSTVGVGSTFSVFLPVEAPTL